MFSTFATAQSIIKSFGPSIPVLTNYWFSFNTTQVSGSTVTCDTKPTTTMTLSSTSAVTTASKEGNQCFFGDIQGYTALCSNIPAIVPNQTGVTVMCWFQVNQNISSGGSMGVNLHLFSLASSTSSTDRFGLYYYQSSPLKFYADYFFNQSVNTNQGGSTANGNWHHISYSMTSTGTMAIVLNGTQVYSTSGNSVSSGNFTVLRVNGRNDLNAGASIFNVDSLRIFPSAQTLSQVQSYYNAGN